MSRTLSAQGAKYFASGLAQLALDWAIFSTLHALTGATVAANLCGRTAGAALGFWLNGRFTFATDGSARLGGARFLRFALAWLAMTALSTGALKACELWLAPGAVYWSKPLIEGFLALLGFIVSRYWIFR